MTRLSSSLIATALLLSGASQAFAGGRTIACYEPLQRPARTETVRERVLVRPEQRFLKTIPAEYGVRDRPVVVAPQVIEFETVPAEWRMEERTIVLRQSELVRRSSPPVYGDAIERVLLSPERITWEWRVIDGRKVRCKVVQPARYGQKTRRVVLQPARTWTEATPAQFGVEQVPVVGRLEQRVPVVTPAQLGIVPERFMIRPERQVLRTVPAQYEMRERRVTVGGGTAWSPVAKDCRS